MNKGAGATRGHGRASSRFNEDLSVKSSLRGRPSTSGSMHGGGRRYLNNQGVPIPQTLVTPFAHTMGPPLEEMKQSAKAR